MGSLFSPAGSIQLQLLRCNWSKKSLDWLVSANLNKKSIKFWPTLAPVRLESIAGIVMELFVFRCSRDAPQLDVLLVALFWGSRP
jgi:hypothetical protein